MLNLDNVVVTKRLSMCVLFGFFYSCTVYGNNIEKIYPPDRKNYHLADDSISSPLDIDQAGVYRSFKNKFDQLFSLKDSQADKVIRLSHLSKDDYDQNQVDNLPAISYSIDSQKTAYINPFTSIAPSASKNLDFYAAIQLAVNRHPLISQMVSNLAAQNANIDAAKSNYYPQISGGFSTGDINHHAGTNQLLTINLTQLVYDFGKTKSAVNEQEAKLLLNQANVLMSIDDIATQTADAIINIKRYQSLSTIAEQQIIGMAKIVELAKLRAQAGISSQADPVQAESYLEAAKSTLISQQSQLAIYQEKLRTLLNFNPQSIQWTLPERLLQDSKVFESVDLGKIPKMMAAQAEIDIATLQKEQIALSRYPTLNLKASVSQAINGVNPNNQTDHGMYNSIMFEANSNFYQGGATTSRLRSAGYAEQAARAQVSAIQLDVLNQVRITRENIENNKRQMQVLLNQHVIAMRTKALYQEQYKLGTRTVVDLLNAEQTIHSASMQIEINRYDIYSNLLQFIALSGGARDIYKLNHINIQGIEIQP